MGESLDQDLLRGILGVLRVVEHPDRDVVDPRLMAPDELLERFALPGSSSGHEAAVLGIGVGDVRGLGPFMALYSVRHGPRPSATEPRQTIPGSPISWARKSRVPGGPVSSSQIGLPPGSAVSWKRRNGQHWLSSWMNSPSNANVPCSEL